MNQLLDNYIKAREQFVSAIDRFPTEKREEMLFGNWNLRQLITHVAGWDNCIADNVESLKKGKEPYFYGGVDDFNAKSVEKGKSWNWEKAYQEFINGGERVVKEYTSLANDLWGKRFWKARNSTPEKFIKIVTKHYSHEHLPQVLRHVK